MSPFFSNTIFNDAPHVWQYGFQDSAAPAFTGIVTLHNTIGFYLIVLCFIVFWALTSIVFYYGYNRNPIAYKYLNHGTIVELVWTITPALILIAIAFPSFRLLYLMDNNILIKENFIFLALFSVKQLKSSSTSIVAIGTLGSTLNIRYSRYCYNSTFFPTKIVSQIIGHLLGDGSLVMARTSINPYFVFTQTLKRFDYT